MSLTKSVDIANTANFESNNIFETGYSIAKKELPMSMLKNVYGLEEKQCSTWVGLGE